MTTIYAAQPYQADRRGNPKPVAGGGHFPDERSARLKAERLWRSARYVGVLVVRQDMNPEIGEYGPYEVIVHWGSVAQPQQPPRFRSVL